MVPKAILTRSAILKSAYIYVAVVVVARGSTDQGARSNVLSPHPRRVWIRCASVAPIFEQVMSLPLIPRFPAYGGAAIPGPNPDKTRCKLGRVLKKNSEP